jgi:tRNA pseudouridine55 synthase
LLEKQLSLISLEREKTLPKEQSFDGPSEPTGFIAIDKPAGRSSAFITRCLGRKIGAKKVGHLGTLDPFASGVLPIAVGGATKLISYITPRPKTYVFEIVFGVKTTTADVTGEKVEESSVIPTAGDLLSVLPAFTGRIHQRPHAFSAIKVNGERAYAMARKGKIPEIPLREISVFGLSFLQQNSENSFTIEAVVSPGTYIRSLAEDIANALGTVAYLQTLIRTTDGKFRIDETIRVEDLEEKSYNISMFLQKPEDVLDDIPVVLIGDCDFRNYLADGRGMPVDLADCGRIFLSGRESSFLAVGCIEDGLAFVRKVVRGVAHLKKEKQYDVDNS